MWACSSCTVPRTCTCLQHGVVQLSPAKSTVLPGMQYIPTAIISYGRYVNSKGTQNAECGKFGNSFETEITNIV